MGHEGELRCGGSLVSGGGRSPVGRGRTWAAASLALAVAAAPAAAQPAAGRWRPAGPGMAWVNALAMGADQGAALYAGTASGAVFSSSDHGATWLRREPGFEGRDITALAVDPTDGAAVYAAVAGTGIYRSRDGGVSWVPSLACHDACALSLARSAPQRLYAVDGSGVLRSDDAGMTWRDLVHGAPVSVVADPTDADTVYVVSGTRLDASRDGGATWVTLLPSSTSTSCEVANATVDPLRRGTVYVSCANPPGLLETADAGATWTHIDGGLGLGPARWVQQLVVDASAPVTLYAAVDFLSPLGAQLYRSADGGASWNLAADVDTQVAAMAIEPRAPGRIYAGTLAGLLRSDDRGSSWVPAQQGLNAYRALVAADPRRAGAIYLAADTDGAKRLFRSSDDGATWNLVGQGLDPGFSINALLADPASPRGLFAGTWNGLWVSSDAGRTWRRGGLGQDVLALASAPGPEPPLYAVAIPQFAGSPYVTFSALASRDGGATWTTLVQSKPLLAGGHGFFGAVIDPRHPQTVYLTGRPTLESDDGGATWRRLPIDSRRGLAIHSRATATLYAGQADGILRSTDGGDTWTPAAPGLATPVWGVVVDAHDPRILYAVTAAGVIVSADHGATWSAFADGSSADVTAVVIDPFNPGTLFAATVGHGLSVASPGKRPARQPPMP